MLQPMRTKFRKAHRGRRRGSAQTGNFVAFGDYGLKVNQLQVSWEVEDKKTKVPADLDRELIEQAKLLNMTPKRFEQLWANNES